MKEIASRYEWEDNLPDTQPYPESGDTPSPESVTKEEKVSKAETKRRKTEDSRSRTSSPLVDVRLELPETGADSAKPAPAEEADPHADVKWQATASKVHVVGDDGIALCLQRKGKRSRPLVRVYAQGHGAKSANSIGVPVCAECSLALSIN